MEPYSRNELQIPEKKTVSPKIQVRLESLPIAAETCSGRANLQFCVIISGSLQVVLKRFYGRTNNSLVLLFPWLGWGIDISDFEKIDFLGHGAIFGLFSPLKTAKNDKFLAMWEKCEVDPPPVEV